MKIDKMRCHPSIILEKTFSFLMVWILILLSQGKNLIAFFTSDTFRLEELSEALPFLALLLLCPFPLAGYHFMVWRKTWIYMEENTLILERNTLNKKKYTYNVAHIASVNTEQNLLELLLRTCRLKLDMNSAANADGTDFSIVLSLSKAQELKSQILSFAKQMPEHTEEIESLQTDNQPYAPTAQILRHCLCSISGFYLVAALVIAAFLGFLFFTDPLTASDILFEEQDFSMRVLTVALLLLSYGYQIVKRLLTFYHFQAFRQGDEIIIHHGFYRKQDYTIPVKRIHALQIVQAPVGRLFGLCEARIVCVGIGDDSKELTQLSLYRRKSELLPYLDDILPEFSTLSINHMQRPAKHAGKVYFCSWLFIALLSCLLPFVTISLLDIFEATEDIDFPFQLYGLIFLSISLFYLLWYRCLGFYLEESLALFSKGALTKTTTLIPYQHMQYLQFKQNPLSRFFHLFHGEVNILASLTNRAVSFPYLNEETKFFLAEHMERAEWGRFIKT